MVIKQAHIQILGKRKRRIKYRKKFQSGTPKWYIGKEKCARKELIEMRLKIDTVKETNNSGKEYPQSKNKIKEKILEIHGEGYRKLIKKRRKHGQSQR